MNWGKATGGLLGLMAGSEALGGPEEAQAGTYPWFKKAMLRSYYDFKHRGKGLRPDRSQPRISAGFLEPRPWEALSGLDPGRKNMMLVSPHPLVSRMKGEAPWPIAKTIRSMEHLLNDPNAAVIPNINPLHGNAPYGVFSQKGNDFLFAPVSPYRDRYYLNTIIGLDGKQAESALAGVEGGHFPSPASLSPGKAGYNGLAVAGSQLRPISDVTPGQSRLSLNELLPNGKRNLSALAGATGAGLSHAGGDDGPAYAYTGKPDLPVGAPWLDPIDVFTAPAGVAGMGGKAIAMAMAPAASYVADRLGGLLGMLGRAHEMQDEEEW